MPADGAAPSLMRRILRALALLLFLLAGRALPAAEAPLLRTFDVPAGPAADTLKQFATQAHREIIFPADPVAGVTTHAIRGRFTSREALDRMVAQTGLAVFEDPATGALLVTRPLASPPPRAAPSAPSEKSPSAMKRKNPFAIIGAWLALAVAHGQPADTGSIVGRVLNSSNDRYLNNARVVVPGTALETFTNEFGEYRLAAVPTGTTTVVATYTGLASSTASVAVAAGRTATQDFNLARPGSATPEGAVVKLDAYIVAGAKDMTAAEIAINEQRYAANLKNVVAADEFGEAAEGNLGEMLKYMPGITIDYVGSDPRNISVRGLPAYGTPILQDGNAVASAASSGASRIVELEQISINNISRIEMTKSPTPDTRADSIGGTINMISRSAFERSKPIFNYKAYLNWNTSEGLFEKTKIGPSREKRTHTYPSFDFSYIRPINANFGITVSGSHSDNYAPDDRSNPQWLPGFVGTTLSTFDRPFLRANQLFESPKTTRRSSIGATVDWRIRHGDVLTFGANYNYYDAMFIIRAYTPSVHATTAVVPTAWSQTFVQSAPGAGGVDYLASGERKSGITLNLTLKYRHDGPVWKLDAGAFHSGASNHYRNGDKGFFSSSTMQLRNITLRMDNISDIGVPQQISATLANGTPVEWNRIGNYRINTGTVRNRDGRDIQMGAHVNAQRNLKLPGLEAPVTLKTGLDVRVMDRDIRDASRVLTFVGPNAATTTDDFASNYPELVDHDYNRYSTPLYGTQRFEHSSPYLLHGLYRAHPEWWTENVATSIQNSAQNSRKLTETIPSAYLRTDFRFFRNRLTVVAGARVEGTIDDGYGVENDLNNVYQRDAAGNFVRNAAGQLVRVPGDAATLARLQFVDRGAHAKTDRYDWFPSANVRYDLTPNLQLRASYAKTINRPNLNEIIPGITVSDPATAGTAPQNLLITINNTALKPWFAENYDLALEYYFGKNGSSLVSVGGFYKEITDFFGTRRTDATTELLSLYGLDDSYLIYDVSYRFNAGDALISGIDFNYRQDLKDLPFLPKWVAGTQVFYNFTQQHLEGTTLADFNSFVRRSDNYGFQYSRPKFTVRLKWNDRGRMRVSNAQAANIAPGAYRYKPPRTTLDAEAEYRFTRNLAFFIAAKNVTNVYVNEDELYGNGTPSYARLFGHWESSRNVVFGLKGSF